MDALHAHLIFNHAGIFGIIFSVCILMVGLALRSDILKRTAMAGFIIASVSAAITMNTGEGAEERVESISGFSEADVEAHEESAELSAWLAGTAGVLSLAGLVFWMTRKRIPAIVEVALLAVALAGSVSIFNTGRLGGKIRHTELASTSTDTPAQTGGDEDDD
jgi:cobalamin synthase